MNDIASPLAVSFSTQLTDIIGWTFLHSLWQLTLIAALAGFVLRAMRAESAGARYITAICFLLAMVACPIATIVTSAKSYSGNELVVANRDVPTPFESVRHSADAEAVIPTHEHSDVTNEGGPEQTAVTPDGTHPDHQTVRAERAGNSEEERSTATATALLTPWLPAFTGFWLLGMICFSLRPVIGYRTVQRLRRSGVSPVSERVRRLFEQTAKQLHIRGSVDVMQSAIVSAPVVVGWLKPLVLLPASAVTGLTESQLQAIIAHELAHVSRHDFVINVFQTIVESALFYHPAIWWLSNRVRVEREHCCDDLVVQAFSDRMAYGRALLAVADSQQGAGVLALGASDGSLLERVRRLFRQDDSQRSFLSGLISVFAVLLLVGGGIAAFALFSKTGQLPENPSAEAEEQSSQMSDEEIQAWKAVFATGVHLNGDGAHRQHLLQHADTLVRTNYPDKQTIVNLRKQGSAPIESVSLFNAPPEVWVHLPKLKSARSLTITASDLPETAWRAIGKMTWLHHVNMINNRSVYPEDLQHFGAMTSLRQIDINLDGHSLSDDERKKRLGELSAEEQALLDEWTNVRRRNLNVPEVAILTDRAFSALSEMRQLRVLRLHNTNCTAAGLRKLEDLRNLEDFDVGVIGDGQQVGSVIAGWKKLRKLNGLSLSDQMLGEWGDLKHLQEIDGWAGNLSFVSIETLAELPVLEELSLRGSKLTFGDVNRLLQMRRSRKTQLKKLDLTHNKLLSASEAEYLKTHFDEIEFRFSEKLPETVAKASGSFSGMVTSDDGSPIPADTIIRYRVTHWVGEHQTESTGGNIPVDGGWFKHEIPIGQLILVAYAEGFAPGWIGPMPLKPDDKLDGLKIKLSRGTAQTVEVRNEKNQLVPSATVWAMPVINDSTNGFVNKQLTDDLSGQFRFQNLADTECVFHVEAERYPSLKTERITPDPDSVLRITLQTNGNRPAKSQQLKIRRDELTISGRAANEDGKPVASADVFLTSLSYGGSKIAQTKTDELGDYTFSKIKLPIEPETFGDGFPVGMFEVFATSDKHGFTWRPNKRFYPDDKLSSPRVRWSLPADYPMDFGPTDHIKLDLHFKSPAAFQATVADPDGKPISGARINILSVEPLPEKPIIETYSELTTVGPSDFSSIQNTQISPPQMRSRISDEAGVFEFETLPPNCEFRVRVDGPAGYEFNVFYVTTGLMTKFGFDEPKVHTSGTTFTLQRSD